MPELRWADACPSFCNLYFGAVKVGFISSNGPCKWLSVSHFDGSCQDAPENTRESAMADLLKRTKAMLREAGNDA